MTPQEGKQQKRWLLAAALRLYAGLTYREIAKYFGFSTARARGLVIQGCLKARKRGDII